MESVVIAIIGVASGVIVFALDRRAARADAKRQQFGLALSDALKWLEVPHRIRRSERHDGRLPQALTERFHDLQEALVFHDAWLRVESPDVRDVYRRLVAEIKDVAQPEIERALVAPTDETPTAGSTVDTPDGVETRVAEFAAAARRHLHHWV